MPRGKKADVVRDETYWVAFWSKLAVDQLRIARDLSLTENPELVSQLLTSAVEATTHAADSAAGFLHRLEAQSAKK